MMDSWPCPEFRSGWDSYFKDKPDKPVMHYSVIAGWFGDHMVMPPGKFFTMVSTKVLITIHLLTREFSSTS
jgi:alcohol oxidase